MEPTSGWRHALSLPLRVSSFGSFDYLAKGPALREVGHIKSSWRDGRNTYPFNETMSFPFPENLRFCTCYRTQNHHEVLLGRTPSLRKACFFVYSFLSMLPLHLGLLPFSAAPSCVSSTQFVRHMAKVHAEWKPKQQGLFLSASDSCQDGRFAAIASLLNCNTIDLELSFESASKLFY